VESLAQQVEHAWEIGKALPAIPPKYAKPANIVVSGMGGSALGARVIKTLYKKQLTIPFEVVNHYELPEYVNENTLVVLSSYSGTTEETLAAGKQALEKKAMIAAIAAGGALETFALEHKIPFFKIDPKFNPSNQPRMAIGYSVFGQLALFARMGIINITDEDVQQVVAFLKKNAPQLAPEVKEHNTAKYLAYAALDKALYMVSAEHLEGAVHVFNNQLNENAKTLTTEYILPEMNHHALESLSFPEQLHDSSIFLLFASALYHPRVQVRFPITQELVEEKGFVAETVLAVAKTKLEQVMEIIQLGAYTNFYLAMLYGIDPAPIPSVDYFKEKLGKIGG
jgi:glucose/mannose-6-phosphate isomerase